MYTCLKPIKLIEFIEGRAAEIGVTLEEVINACDYPHYVKSDLDTGRYLGDVPRRDMACVLELHVKWLHRVEIDFLGYSNVALYD